MSQPEVQAAFRAGLTGRPFRESETAGLAEAPATWSAGPNETLLADLDRLPGLSEARAAYGTGRAIKRIMELFDQAGAPAAVGRQFLDNIHGAVTAQAMRDRRVVWGGSDTVAMFMEMYGRVLGDGADFAKVESALLEHALSEPGRKPGRASALLRALRRR